MQATSSHWKNLRFCSNVAVRRTKAAPILASEIPLGMYLHQARAFLPVPIAIFSETSIIQAASAGDIPEYGSIATVWRRHALADPGFVLPEQSRISRFYCQAGYY